ncbi:spore gernimation protein [Brevibacillus choshinensis]|uniref:spore gernimation protein n=1 Tax=Brevibacillus choshinensis TaxID=54911 RepID=UPI000A441B76|nr:spore gernimation protein [Brevibacillus choshinensis]
MIYKVINGDVHVGSINIVNLSAAASLFIGDCKSVILGSIFETPPESFIVGVEQPARTP